jgi:hypothetical protein
MSPSDLVARSFAAFSVEAVARPTVTLRGGNDLDDYRQPSPFDKDLDAISDAYLEQYFWGVGFLDPASWRYYLPYLIEYAIRNSRRSNNVTDALLNSLRPPDRNPPRLASLSPEQEAAVTSALDHLAFADESAYKDLACQALEEWWTPGALYRPVGQ